MDATDYYKLRLEQTLEHTQRSTNLIYLLNGAVLAMLYFLLQLPIWNFRHIFISIVVAALGCINIFHGLLIFRQGMWYHNIDKALAGSVQGVVEIARPWGVSSHNLYAYLHGFLGIALLLIALVICLHPDVLPVASMNKVSKPSVDESKAPYVEYVGGQPGSKPF